MNLIFRITQSLWLNVIINLNAMKKLRISAIDHSADGPMSVESVSDFLKC